MQFLSCEISFLWMHIWLVLKHLAYCIKWASVVLNRTFNIWYGSWWDCKESSHFVELLFLGIVVQSFGVVDSDWSARAKRNGDHSVRHVLLKGICNLKLHVDPPSPWGIKSLWNKNHIVACRLLFPAHLTWALGLMIRCTSGPSHWLHLLPFSGDIHFVHVLRTLDPSRSLWAHTATGELVSCNPS
jgi:hypothetical protein